MFILPSEIWVKIFSHADFSTTCKTEQVCRAWKALHKEESLTVWLPKVRALTDDGWVPHLLKGETFKDVYRIHYAWERVGEWTLESVGSAEMVGEEVVGGIVKGSNVFGVAASDYGWHTYWLSLLATNDADYCVEVSGNTTFLHKRKSSLRSTYALTSRSNYHAASPRLPPDSTSLLVHSVDSRSDLIESRCSELMGVVMDKYKEPAPSIHLFDSRTLRQCHHICFPAHTRIYKAKLNENVLAVVAGIDEVEIRVYHIENGVRDVGGPIHVWRIGIRYQRTYWPFALDAHRIAWPSEPHLISVRNLDEPESTGATIRIFRLCTIIRLEFTRTQLLALSKVLDVLDLRVFSLRSHTRQNIITVNLHPYLCERIRLSDCGAFLSILSVPGNWDSKIWEPLASVLDVVSNKTYGWEQRREGKEVGDVHDFEGNGSRNGFFLWYRSKQDTVKAGRDLECVWVRLKP